MMQHMLLGRHIKEKGIGGFGDASVFSFHATKVFHTIEGGAVAVSKKEQYDTLYNLKNFGIRGTELVVAVGANAKMNEFAAIMGICNLKRYDEAIESRRIVFERYKENLLGMKGIRFLLSDDTENKNYAYLPVIFAGDGSEKRDEIYKRLIDDRVYARKYFYPLTSDQACFRNKHRKDNLTTARNLAETVLTLPLYEGLSTDDVDRICGIILSVK